MNRFSHRLFGRARGSVAVECAIILPIFIAMMAAVLLFGRILWHYTVVQKAAHDAARFLATASLQEMKPGVGGSEVPAAVIAHGIAMDEVAELKSGGGLDVVILCQFGSNEYWSRCNGFDVPKRVLASVEIAIADPFFNMSTSLITYGQPIFFRAAMATDYVGN